jgi:hypothetical protein
MCNHMFNLNRTTFEIDPITQIRKVKMYKRSVACNCDCCSDRIFLDCPHTDKFGEIFGPLYIGRTAVTLAAAAAAEAAVAGIEYSSEDRSIDFLRLTPEGTVLDGSSHVIVKLEAPGAEGESMYAQLMKIPYQLTQQYTTVAAAHDASQVLKKGTWVCRIKILTCISSQSGVKRYVFRRTNVTDGYIMACSALQRIPKAVLTAAGKDRSNYMNVTMDPPIMMEGKMMFVFKFDDTVYDNTADLRSNNAIV